MGLIFLLHCEQITETACSDSQGAGTSKSRDAPKTIREMKKVTTINPIMRRILIPAMARMGRAKKGWSIFATDSPMATAMVVPAKEA
jgi:hypothetical protein